MSVREVVPEDMLKRGFDVLNGKIGTRTHCIHLAMVTMPVPRTAEEIGKHAKTFATNMKMVTGRTFASDVTENHLRTQSGRGYSEKVGDLWKLTDKAWKRIGRKPSTATATVLASPPSASPPRSPDAPRTATSALRVLSKKELREAEELEDHIVSAKVRKYQRIFRDNLMLNFDNRCCLSGVHEPKLLVASHIVGWAEDRAARIITGNGLLLFVTYDKLFDKHYFTVEDDLSIRIVPWFHLCSEPVRTILTAINGKRIREGKLESINREYLRRHREKFALHSAPSALPEELP